MTATEYGDPADWDNEIPFPLAEKIYDELVYLGWNVTCWQAEGVEITAGDGTETGVWMASGGRLWTGRSDGHGECRNPVQVHADPRDPQAVAATADRLMREIGLRP